MRRNMKTTLITLAVFTLSLVSLGDYQFATITNATTGAIVMSKITPDGSPIATSNMVEKIAERYYMTATQELFGVVWDIASFTASNTVERILTPEAVAFNYTSDGNKTNSVAMAKDWVTGRIDFVDVGEGDDYAQGELKLYHSGQLRNYEIFIESIPTNSIWFLLKFDEISLDSRIYSMPEFTDPESEAGQTVATPFQYGWVITTNDVPCTVTIREPEKGLVLLRREKTNLAAD